MSALTSKIKAAPSHSDAISLADFSVVLHSLAANVARLDRSPCRGLVNAIIEYDWLEADALSPSFSTFVEKYGRFLAVLVSSIPKYLQTVLRKLVNDFADVDGDLFAHHSVLAYIVKFVPTSTSSIPTMMTECMPHHLSCSPSELTKYIKNCMRAIEYCPELQFPVWQMAIECCIKLDVDLQNEIDDLDDESIEELINAEEDEAESGDADEDDDEGEEVFAPISTRKIKTMVEQLDSLLELLLQSREAFGAEWEKNTSLFSTMLTLFKTHILPTHFTKLVQFLLFVVTQQQTELVEHFLCLLTEVAFDQAETMERRLKAIQYIASYTARARNLMPEQIEFMVKFLVDWLDRFIVMREAEIDVEGHGGMERFKLFYAGFQALAYIFCFRHKVLIKDNGWLSDVDKFFQRAIIAKFNPLKYCDETVVSIFAKMASNFNVCYCYSVIEYNKRERMLQKTLSMAFAAGNFRHKQEFLDLEAYFPFDPLVLPNCKRIVARGFVEWAEANPNEEDDDDADDSVSLRDEESSSDEE